MRKRSAVMKRQALPGHLWLLQCIAVAATTLVAGGVSGAGGMLSSLTGGMVCLVPQLFFIWRLGRLHRRQPRGFVVDFYRAEAGKFGLTMALFGVAFVTVPPSNPIFFFSAYVAAQLMYWLAPWLMHDRPTP